MDKLKKRVLLVITLAFILSFLIALLLPYIPLYGEDIGLSISMIGYVIAVYHITQFAGRIPMGSLTDTFGYGKIILFGGISLFFSMIFYILSPGLWPLLFLAQMFIGIVVCMEWVTLPSFMTSVDLDRIPLFTFVVGIAYTFSVPLGGVLKDALGMQLLFLMGFLLSIPSLYIVYLIIKDEKQNPQPDRNTGNVSFISLYKDAFKTLKNPQVMRGSLYSLLMFLNFNIAISIFPLQLSFLGFSATIIGGIQFARIGSETFIRLFSKKIETVLKKKTILMGSTLASGLSLYFVSQTSSLFMIIIISLLWGTISGLYHPVVFEVVAAGTDEENRGKGMGVRGTMGTLGSFTGIIIFSNIAEYFSIALSLALAGITILFGVLFIELFMDYRFDQD